MQGVMTTVEYSSYICHLLIFVHSLCLLLNVRLPLHTVIEDALSWTPRVCCCWAGPGPSWEGRQVWADAGFDHLGERGPKWFPGNPRGGQQQPTCTRAAVWLGLMNCLVEQNYIMLVLFKRIWQVLRYAGWCYNLNYGTAGREKIENGTVNCSNYFAIWLKGNMRVDY